MHPPNKGSLAEAYQACNLKLMKGCVTIAEARPRKANKHEAS